MNYPSLLRKTPHTFGFQTTSPRAISIYLFLFLWSPKGMIVQANRVLLSLDPRRTLKKLFFVRVGRKCVFTTCYKGRNHYLSGEGQKLFSYKEPTILATRFYVVVWTRSTTHSVIISPRHLYFKPLPPEQSSLICSSVHGVPEG